MILGRQFDLAALAKAKGLRRQTFTLPPNAPRLAFEQTLERIIRRVIAPAIQMRPDILASAAALRSSLTQDAFTLSTIMAALRGAFSQQMMLAEGPIASLFGAEGRRHGERWMDQVNRVIGVDLQAVVRGSDIAPAIEIATRANVALIKGLSDEVAKKIETSVLDLVSRGASNKEIASALAEIGTFGKARAKLIAVDQAESFNASLNQIRQEQAGVTSYVWSTSRDRRVRPLHRAREGQTFRWDSPPSDGHPGRPVRCRCVARAVLDLNDVPAKRSPRARRAGTAAVAEALGLSP